MQDRRYRPGDVLDDYCPRERRITDHAIVAMVEEDIQRTRCSSCDAEHEYKAAKVPAPRRKTQPPALFAQVLDGMQGPTPRPQSPPPPPSPVVDESPAVPLAVAAAAYVAQLLIPGLLVRALLEPIALGIAVVFIACGLPYLGNFARFGDLSYGIYIIHFPVIQAAVAAGLYARDPWLAFALSTGATIALAFLCWHAVEKPFLSRRSHYRLAAGA